MVEYEFTVIVNGEKIPVRDVEITVENNVRHKYDKTGKWERPGEITVELFGAEMAE